MAASRISHVVSFISIPIRSSSAAQTPATTPKRQPQFEFSTQESPQRERTGRTYKPKQKQKQKPRAKAKEEKWEQEQTQEDEEAPEMDEVVGMDAEIMRRK
jgi:hypothetical protein